MNRFQNTHWFVVCLVLASLTLSTTCFCAQPFTFEDMFHTDSKTAQKLFGEATVRRLQQALEDFNAVLRYKRPVHAKVDNEYPAPADGGTRSYRGDGYRLTIVQSLNAIRRAEGEGQVDGITYGPIITFNPDLMFGNRPNIEQLTFYPESEFIKLPFENKQK